VFDQTETGYQHASDLPSISDDPIVEHFGNPGPSGPLPGVSGTCPDPIWSIEPNMAHQPQDSNFQISTIPTPSMSHESNPPISSRTISLQHQRGTGIHLPTSGRSQNNFGESPLLDPTIELAPEVFKGGLSYPESADFKKRRQLFETVNVLRNSGYVAHSLH